MDWVGTTVKQQHYPPPLTNDQKVESRFDGTTSGTYGFVVEEIHRNGALRRLQSPLTVHVATTFATQGTKNRLVSATQPVSPFAPPGIVATTSSAPGFNASELRSVYEFVMCRQVRSACPDTLVRATTPVTAIRFQSR